MTQKTPDSLAKEIMACCPVTNLDTRSMYFTQEEKTRFTTFVQAYFDGTPFTPGVSFENDGNNLIKMVTVLVTRDHMDPIGANFSPVVIHHWLSAQETKTLTPLDDAVKAAEGYLGILNAMHGLYPVEDVAYRFTEAELKELYTFTVPFFQKYGFGLSFTTETGPDTGTAAMDLLKLTIELSNDNGPVHLVTVWPYLVRAFLNDSEAKKTELLLSLQQPFDDLRNFIPVEVKVLDEELYWGKDFAPKGSADAAGIDLMAAVEEDTYLEPGETKLIPTGLAFYIKNPNYVGLIHPRSGLGHKHGIVLGNLTGVIDADYNGQLMVSLWNRNTQGEPFKITRGDRIAQYLIQPVVHGLFQQVNEFSQPSERGGNGFGASGLGQQVTTHNHADHHSNVTKADVKLGELPEAVKDMTFGERMNALRPRIFKKEGVFTKEEMAANMGVIMANLQEAIDLHRGQHGLLLELNQNQLQLVISWAIGFINGSGGDASTVKIVVERYQDWNHEAGELFDRRVTINLFYGEENQFVRITNPAATFIFKNYVTI